jgi:hypothetical protein
MIIDQHAWSTVDNSQQFIPAHSNRVVHNNNNNNNNNMIHWSLQLTLLVLVTQQQLIPVISLSSSKTKNSEVSTPTTAVTIAVCMGADCRVDGASDCLRQLQQHPIIQTAARNTDKTKDRKKKLITVKARSCFGPCGDGPCVRVEDSQKRRIVRPREFSNPKSIAPPELFGDSNRGVYQVRTAADVDFVVNLAATTAGVNTDGMVDPVGQQTSTNDHDEEGTVVVRSTRAWYDRPRNERKVLQRLMQFLVVVGLYDEYKAHGAIDTVQWQVAGILFVASNFIMKENLIDQLLERARKKLKLRNSA